MSIVLMFIGCFLFVVGLITQFSEVPVREEILNRDDLAAVREILRKQRAGDLTPSGVGK